MKYYIDENSEIYAYEDDVSDESLAESIKRFRLTPLTQKELEKFLTPKMAREQKIERLKQEFLARVDATLNTTAHEHGYDNINTAVSYAGYENKFQAEGISFGKWRSKVYEWGYGLLEKIMKGELDIDKTNIDEVLQAMPAYQGVGK
jgi:hypothetical protein